MDGLDIGCLHRKGGIQLLLEFVACEQLADHFPLGYGRYAVASRVAACALFDGEDNIAPLGVIFRSLGALHCLNADLGELHNAVNNDGIGKGIIVEDVVGGLVGDGVPSDKGPRLVEHGANGAALNGDRRDGPLFGQAGVVSCQIRQHDRNADSEDESEDGKTF
ncbi:hypothetical protein SDC9_145361 [bioreactor metagenome]|uniref:Uncharacterized protein n=1 Tax=bioreactor metagenome TaxID=1076179 RepID=A0A645EAM1_9ZZZZ